MEIDKKLFWKTILMVLVVFVIVGFIVLLFIWKSEGTLCLKDPFVYGANHVGVKSSDGTASDTANVSCSCVAQTLEGHAATSRFCFNNEGVNSCNTEFSFNP